MRHDATTLTYTDSAADFYDELRAAVKGTPAAKAVRRAYWRFQLILGKFLDQRTASSRVIFAGPFAKMDYLLKEHGASWQLSRSANDARRRIRHSGDTDDGELGQTWRDDMQALCRFIAVVDGVAVPADLAAMFPKDGGERQTERTRVLGDSMRMIVTSWDDTTVTGDIEGYPEEGGSKVSYAKGNKYFPFDWSYLKDMFHDGTQINLIRPHLGEGGVIMPELIIVEPDYLVNVTTVARCFSHYAESPMVSLIHKIEPKADSQAILLGNFAGQLLDEELCGEPMPTEPAAFSKRYSESAMTFFRHNTLSMLTTEYDKKQFHRDARRQAVNIHKAMSEILPTMAGYHSEEGIVEPSFFSEMLGIQGRMDFMQMDYRYVIEQKSGKGAFPYENFVSPRATDEHSVQIQLYMLLFRYVFRRRMAAVRYDMQPFLLYSKYDNSLLRVSAMPELIFKAIKIRNGIAAMEMGLTRRGGYDILGTMTPETLNENHVDDKLWRNYQQPQLARTLDPIHKASELERHYVSRMMTFISNEHVLSKLGNKTKECSGFASTWHDSLQEKRLAGNIYDRLTLEYPATGTKGAIERVVLRFADDVDNDMSNFRKGDIVILYPYDGGSEPDARQTMILRCTIADITGDNHIVLRLRHPQSDNRIFVHAAGRPWAIEHDFMESSYTGLYRGVYAFLSAPKERRDLLMFRREPSVDKSRRLRGDYGSFNEMMLRVKQARDFFLIIGPPGTGKTSFGLLNTLREELMEPDSSVLLMSYTNRAVDEICCKLTEAGIDFIRIGGEMTASADYAGNLITERIAGAERLGDVQDMLTRNRVYVGTTTAVSAHQNIFGLKHFDLAIIDEASQILEPHLMGLLSADNGGVPAISKFVMIGDHKQLPAVVQQTADVSRVDDPMLQAIGLDDCRYSLFERLLRRYGNDPAVTFMLTKQGRMHPDIATFPNEAFYGGRLDVVPLEHQKAVLPDHGNGADWITDMLMTKRIAFIAVDKPDDAPSDKVNPIEANLIAAIVKRIYDMERAVFDADETVGVIVPYRNQISAVRKVLDGYGIRALHNITIDTVERFQGSQRRYIVYGFTIQKYYQLNFLTANVFTDSDGTVVDRKLNVAMTRAEEHLIMTGYAPLLRRDDIFDRLIDFVKSRNGYIDKTTK